MVDLALYWLVLSAGLLVLLAIPAAIAEWWRGRRNSKAVPPVVPLPLLGKRRAVDHAMSYHRHDWDEVPTPLVGGKSAIRGGTIEEIAHKLIVETGGRTW